jgi:hypothetical protein
MIRPRLIILALMSVLLLSATGVQAQVPASQGTFAGQQSQSLQTVHTAVAKQGNNQLDAFYIGTDGGVYVSWVIGGGVWEGPVRITPANVAAPGASVTAAKQLDNQLDVLFVGNDGGVYVSWVIGGGVWEGPVRITPANIAAPGASVTAARQLDNQLDVFFVGNDGGVYVSWVIGGGIWVGPVQIAWWGDMSTLPTLVQLSSDPYTNSDSQHKTEVEPDSFSFGSTIVTAFQVGRFETGGASNIGWATSIDNGRSWTNGFLPGITKLQGGTRYDRVSDPSVAYDAAHNVWLVASLPIVDSANGILSPTVLVSRSGDGGHTWDTPVTVATGVNFDKTWIVCDNTASSPSYGYCYTEWDDVNDHSRIKMSTSTDGGLTWQPALNTGDNAVSAEGLGGQPVVQPNGTVIVPFLAGDAILAFRSLRSPDGRVSWSNSSQVALVWDEHKVGPDADPMRTEPVPSAEIDGAGKVYVVWQDCRFENACAANDLVMSASIDGTDWSPVVRIPTDEANNGSDHFIPGLAVDKATSGGAAHLALTYYYYPSANCDPFTCQLEVGFISSADGGVHWGAKTQLAGPMRVNWLPKTSLGRMVGDYISTSFSSNGMAHPVFAIAKAPLNAPDCSTTVICDEAIHSLSSGLAASGGDLLASSIGSAVTHAGNIITAAGGGTATTSDGSFRIDFPSNAVISPTLVIFKRLQQPSQALPLGNGILRSFTLDADTIDGQPVTRFQQPYTMVISYSAAELAAVNVSEASLKLAFWDTASNHWVSVPMSVDTVNHSVTASLDHFTEFALFGSKQLDDFNRPNGSLGSSWSGHTEGGNYQIHDQQLHVHVGDRGTLYWQSDTFGSMQEAFVTLARLDTRTKGEDARQGVLLKVQGAIPDTINGAIEVRYYAQARKVRVQSRLPGQNWQVLTEIPASFADGDQLGARALAGGHVQVFLNGMLIGEADAGAFFANIGGRIGLRCIDARDTLLDDFGGGDVSSMDRNPTPSNNRTSSVVHLPLLWR